MNHRKTLPSLKELVTQPLYYPYPYCYLYYPPAQSTSSSSATEPDIYEAQGVSVLQSMLLKRQHSTDSELSLVSSYVSSDSSSFAPEKKRQNRTRRKKEATPLNPEWVVPTPPWVQRAQQGDGPPTPLQKRPSRSAEDPGDEDPYQIDWTQSLSIPQEIQAKAWKAYERLVQIRDLRVVHNGKRRKAFMSGVIFILCRQEGHPRTFSEIAAAAGVQKKDVGHCFRWLLPYMSEEQTVPRVHPYEFIKRWCQDLSIPEYAVPMCVQTYDAMSGLMCFSSKCPSNLVASVILAVIWAVNCAQSLLRSPADTPVRKLETLPLDTCPPRIPVSQRQVANVACIGITTLHTTYRLILAQWDKVMPKALLVELLERNDGAKSFP